MMMMNSIQLKCLFSKLYPNQFCGVYSIDELVEAENVFNSHPNENALLVINTAPQNHPGLHWISIMSVNQHLYYIDSLAELPPTQNLVNFIDRISNQKRYFSLPYAIQQSSGGSDSCGCWLVYFACRLFSGATLSKSLLPFSPETKIDNDLWVIDWCKALCKKMLCY